MSPEIVNADVPQVPVLATKIIGEEAPPVIFGVSAEPKMPPVAAAGVELSKWVLVITACSIVLLVFYLIVMDASGHKDDESFRKFWLQVAQLLLLNLLLPLLTALFGYVFGSQQAQKNGRS